jgi:hypothetical protein
MDNEVKSLETTYKGVKFRSRTEARWAVFFDMLKIKWVYEHEGYDLGKLGWYLPDFFLPDFSSGTFAEVKGKDFSIKEVKKCYSLCDKTGLPVIMLDGLPSIKCYYYFEKLNNSITHYHGLINADQAAYENRMYVLPGYENKDLTIPELYYDCVGEAFINAVNTAKSYRF